MVLLSLATLFYYNLVCALNPCEVKQPSPQTSIEENYNFYPSGNIFENFTTSSKRKKAVQIADNLVSSETVDPYPIVLTRNGAVQGYSMGTVQGRRIFAFEGIPYSEPPLNELRFQAPLPKSKWHGVLKAQSPGSKCLQGHPIDLFRISGSEDCLYLSVYRPMILKENLNSTAELPVIVWMHGGSFMYGSGSEYGPVYLLDQEVVLVTINYRLGALGFLSLGSHISGNFGLKDQALAIKWVHDNIDVFGGDKTRVTLMGQSAGGVSAHLHAISKKSRKYFQSGYSISGSAFCHWGVISQDRAARWTHALAKNLNCPNGSDEELMHCFQTANSVDLVAAQLRIFEWTPLHPLIVFAPVVEPDGPDAFLTQSPLQAYDQKEVANYPWVFTTTSQEGYFELYVLQTLLQTLPVRRNVRSYLPFILDYFYLLEGSARSELTDDLLRFYEVDSNLASLDKISQMYSDRYFVTPVQKAMKMHSNIAPVYGAVFDFKGDYNIGSIFGVNKQNWGIPHGEDIFYYFNSSFYHGFSKKDNGYELSTIMNNVLSNFARNKIPSYKYEINSTFDEPEIVELNPWEPIKPSESKLNLLRFSKDIRMISNPFHRRVRFWEGLKLVVTNEFCCFNC